MNWFWCKWSTGHGTRWSTLDVSRSVRVRGHTRPEINLQAWPRNHFRPTLALNSFLMWANVVRIVHALRSADCDVPRCPSVCLSITRRYYVETAKHIIKRFSSDSGSHIIPVFFQTLCQYSDRDPITGASSAGYDKLKFSINISLYLRNDTR